MQGVLESQKKMPKKERLKLMFGGSDSREPTLQPVNPNEAYPLETGVVRFENKDVCKDHSNVGYVFTLTVARQIAIVTMAMTQHFSERTTARMRCVAHETETFCS